MTAGLVVEARGLSKWFGEATARDGADFTITGGVVHGLLGPNGADKSTLLSILFGLVLPDEGTVRLFGRTRSDVGANWLDGVGGFVESSRFYPYLSARQNLRIMAGLDGSDSASLIDSALERVGLANARRRKVRGYSLGMRQRLGRRVGVARTDTGRVLVWHPDVWSRQGRFNGPRAIQDWANPAQLNRLDWYSAHNWRVLYHGDSKILPPNAVPSHNLPAGYLGD